MKTQHPQRSFDDVLSVLGSQKFDVAAAREGAGAKRVSKHGCAAEIAGGKGGAVVMVSKPGWVLGGEISRILDRGYQKFLKTSRVEIPATAMHLRALHDFQTELNAATGEITMFNESLGTTSDTYEYDRVLGRPDQPVR